MTEQCTGEMVFGPNGLEYLRFTSPDNAHRTEIALGPGGEEHIVRRAGAEVSTKTSVQREHKDRSEFRVADLLRQHLNSLDISADWREVEKTDETVEPDADAVILGATGARLRLQIVRADPDPGRWRFASQVSLDVYVGEDELTLKAAAARLLAAISHKEGSYPSNVKAELVLVLDALAVPEANEPAVQELVRTAVTTTGFQSVWVCGTLESQIWQVASVS